MRKIKVVIGQLGSPKTPKTRDVRVFLRDFLGDPRVVDINPWLWKVILYLFVLPFRPKKSGEAYSRIWNGKSFPLVDITNDFTDKMKPYVDHNIELNSCFLLSHPTVDKVFDDWEKEDFATRATEVLVIPQFPQYAESTSASVVDKLGASLSTRVNIPSFTFMSHYHNSKVFIDHSVKRVNSYLREWNKQPESKVDALILSFHGIPLRRVLEKKDLYYQHCWETFYLIRERVTELNHDQVHICFQSRFGSEQWLGPATDDYAVDLVEKQGLKNIAVYCPSFVVDCLETIDEIGSELGEELEEVGGQVRFIPCLNDDEQWSQDFASFINTHVNGSREEKQQMYYPVEDRQEIQTSLPEQTYEQPPLPSKSKAILGVVFLTAFLDLIGFSIIFPMFPAMAQYYLENNAADPFLQGIFSLVYWLAPMSEGVGDFRHVVLFGGILGALYSFLNFVAAPLWGSYSDRIGRKPVLLITVFGLFLSYVLWFFAGSFTLLIFARFIGGIMGGNLSTATAVVADVTDETNRSKGMSTIGIAFALGFVFGPALGGILTSVNIVPAVQNTLQSLSESSLLTWILSGVNPFSVPALAAAILSLMNLYVIYRFLPETRKPQLTTSGSQLRSANPIKILKPLPFPGINLVNYAYFLFILAFAGMEFTLTFVAVERFAFTPLQNGYMFIFIGLVIALVQGGYVRRKARQVGENKMAKQGLVSIIPGLIIIAYAQSVGVFYLGLFLLAKGSAMAIPCFTAMASLLTPKDVQGRVLGIFRSMGALGRVIGPISASLIYWSYGATFPYLLGSLFLLIPLFLLVRLKEHKLHPNDGGKQRQ